MVQTDMFRESSAFNSPIASWDMSSAQKLVSASITIITKTYTTL